ncbi:MAG: 2-C-methyl-D-erythritol 2,4-cyclodiphosphate synthase [Bacteroidetes bacterium]|nr:MAG: 2-C-methyl-D-erythritol 2,4-cyclodiphosphate synthase [Bacteroidota bacterium]
MADNFKIGTGYDVHRLVEGRPLWLGGVKIPFIKGCLAHSDGDVLLHAIIDALLGALALGDIGNHFPDTDSRYKDISSVVLLQKTILLVKQRGFIIGNLDTTLVLQQPKVSSFISEMRLVIAKILETNIENVSIKATTTEGLGFSGTGEGVAAQAVVLLLKG